MKILNISNHQFRKMVEYKPGENFQSMECKLYLIKEKSKWNTKYKLFKKYNKNTGPYFSNKLYTINELINNRNSIGVDEIVYPSKLVSVDNEICGYSMPFIDNINLKYLLNDPNISIQEKIRLLKEVGILLEKVNHTKILYLSDIHEGNFIYDKGGKKILAVDMDSCKIGNNDASVSKYLTFNPNLWDYPHKYPMDEDDIHIANKNTTYLSYIYMILNFISGVEYISQLTIEDYYRYLERLRNLGFDQELIDVFGLVYTKQDNVSPVELLDSIPKDLTKANYRGIIKK